MVPDVYSCVKVSSVSFSPISTTESLLLFDRLIIVSHLARCLFPIITPYWVSVELTECEVPVFKSLVYHLDADRSSEE
ncbi:hypothetical protein E2C01_015919 [Portunus trituberculatus]|uniref:Uncharacterized protein n=1 Tax=Portunus trituberculatus TaxID=210409 RepID=A0A5B7DMR9_PORTR|nr:hypothetical protein [Portunus trituberculatus]